MTPPEIITELVRISKLLDEALIRLRDRGRLLAERERDYRKARAKAWLVTEGTAKQREDAVNAETSDLRYARDLADHDRQSANEAVRNYRTQISALQSIASAYREEAAMARTSPQ